LYISQRARRKTQSFAEGVSQRIHSGFHATSPSPFGEGGGEVERKGFKVVHREILEQSFLTQFPSWEGLGVGFVVKLSQRVREIFYREERKRKKLDVRKGSTLLSGLQNKFQ